MADWVRESQQVVEVTASGQVPAVRLSQIVINVSASGQVPNARLSQLVIEITTEWPASLKPSVSSNLAAWNDAIDVFLDEVEQNPSVNTADDLNSLWDWDVKLGLGLNYTEDDLNSWDDDVAISQTGFNKIEIPLGLDVMYFYDSIQVDFLVFIGGLSVSVSDDLNNWNDSKNFQHTGYLQESNEWYSEDTMRMGDSIQISFLLDSPEVADDLNNWGDEVGGILGVPEAFDSNMYNWADAISVVPGFGLNVADTLSMSDAISAAAGSFLLSKSAADSMFNLLDAVKREYKLHKRVADFMVLTDRASVRFNATRAIADYMSMLDAIVLDFLSNHDIGDTMTLTDAVSVGLSVHLTKSVADTLVMSDAVSGSKSTSDMNYLRRYLNDVPR